jgi:hypothetical protein
MTILVVLGVLAIAAGIIYYAEPATSLPAFFPGHAAQLNGRHTTRGLVGIIAGAVLLIVAVITARAGRRSSRMSSITDEAARAADGAWPSPSASQRRAEASRS